MRRWLPFLLPFGAIVGAGVVLKGWSVLTTAPPCQGYEAVVVDDVDPALGCVTLQGQAHYEVVVRQTVPGNLVFAEQQLYLFPLFPDNDVDDRAIRVLVRTERAPDDLVSFETMTVLGRLERITPDNVPFGTEIEIGKRSDYFFTDTMVMVIPDRIDVDGESVWLRE